MKRLTISLMFMVLLYGVAWAQPRSAEVERLQQQITSNSMSVRVMAAKKISSSGLQDEQLFKTIHQQLIKRFNKERSGSNYAEELSWLCKALASSGNSDYAPILRTIAKDSDSYKLRHYAAQSLEMIPEYARRNRIINQPLDADSTLSVEQQRWANMVQSDNVKLKRDGAKKIIRSGSLNEELFDIVYAELMANYQRHTTDAEHVDTMAWLCKALGASGYGKYRDGLIRLRNTTNNEKLKDYCTDAAAQLAQP